MRNMDFGTSFALFLIIVFFFVSSFSTTYTILSLSFLFWKEGDNNYLRVVIKDLDKTQENCILKLVSILVLRNLISL